MDTPHEIISRPDLKKKIDEDQDLHLIEVLPEEEFREGHLPGAVNIPGDKIRETAPERIPARNDTVVVYCASPSCTASDRAAELLTDMGYHHVFHYRGGKQHWKEGGLPLENGQN